MPTSNAVTSFCSYSTFHVFFLFFFFFILRTYSPVPVFASFSTFFFFFLHIGFHINVLKKGRKKEHKKSGKKNACDEVLFIFPAMSLSRSFEIFVSQLHIPPESLYVWQRFCPKVKTTSHPHLSSPINGGVKRGKCSVIEGKQGWAGDTVARAAITGEKKETQETVMYWRDWEGKTERSNTMKMIIRKN